MSKEWIEIFTGNRAEFGILFPYIIKFSKLYNIKLLVSGAHLLEDWNTINEINSKISKLENRENIEIIELNVPQVKKDDIYTFAEFIPIISKVYIDYSKNRENQKAQFILVLGDRIETLAVVFSAMYLNQVIAHVCGGDIANIPAYDTNVRHSITKASHIHLVTNSRSYNVVKQLGEEEWRICNVGTPSLDFDRLGIVTSKKELSDELDIIEDELILFTYHPEHYVSADDNFGNFQKALDGVTKVGVQMIITYPNNDPGSSKMIDFLESLRNQKNIKIVKNLGIDRYFGLMKNFKTILVGNSSSMVTESAYFNVPAILVGERQKGRLRGKNVFEYLHIKPTIIANKIREIFKDYTTYQTKFVQTRYIYGKGDSALKALKFINGIFGSKERKLILTKTFNEYFSGNG